MERGPSASARPALSGAPRCPFTAGEPCGPARRRPWFARLMASTQQEPSVLAIDAAVEAQRIARALAEQVERRLRRRGIVLGLSGGVDSAVVAALSVLALGAPRV